MSILDRAKQPSPKLAKEPGVAHPGFLKIFERLAGRARLTYRGLGVVAHHYGMCQAHEIGRPSSFRAIAMLPLAQQHAVCRDDGSYKSSVMEKWQAEAPEGFEQLPILKAEDVMDFIKEVESEVAPETAEVQEPVEKPKKSRKRKAK